MTALAAVFHRDGRPIERVRFTLVADALRPFGSPAAPWHDGPAGLVALPDARFVAESARDSQPVAAGPSLLLFDGLLADRRALVGALGLEPRTAAQQTDGELFARAWAQWGEEAALRVEGSFAAVAWTPRTRVLAAVCSPLYSPPLYYAVDRRRAIVASAPRAIFAWGDMARRIDDAVLASSMINDQGDGRATCWRGVSSLLAGEALTVSPKTARVRQYYDLAERAQPIRLAADGDYVDAAGELLRHAVDSAMRGADTPAIFLSGGIDSSAIAVAALERRAGRGDPAPLVSLTGVPAPGQDVCFGTELRARVGALAATYPALDARFYHVGAVDAEQSLLKLMELTELPMRSLRRAQLLGGSMRAVAEAGRNVFLDGVGGNDALSHNGLALLASLLRAGRLPSLWRESAGGERGRRLGRFTPLWRHALYRNLPRRLHGAVRRLVHGQHGWADYSAIHPVFARAHRVDERARASGFDPYEPAASVRGALLTRWERTRRRRGNAEMRAVEAAFGLQVRSPFFNRRLVEWCVGLPDEQFLRDGQSRHLIRQLMGSRLPSEIWRSRLKWPFSPVGKGELPAIRATLEGWRADPSVAERVDLPRLLRLLDVSQATPVTRRNYSDRRFALHGLDHALAVGRFVRWAEGGGNWASA